MSGFDPDLRDVAMPAVAHDPAAAVLDETFRDVADIGNHLDTLWSVAWAHADGRLLELCRLRLAQLLRDDATLNPTCPSVDEETLRALSQWPTSPRFDERDRACLAFCEMWVIDVASIDDSLVSNLTRHLGARGLVDFASALLIIEQRQRLALVWRRLDDVGESRRGA